MKNHIMLRFFFFLAFTLLSLAFFVPISNAFITLVVLLQAAIESVTGWDFNIAFYMIVACALVIGMMYSIARLADSYLAHKKTRS